MSKPHGRLAIVGGGWAGCAAAIKASDAGWDVTLFEASQHAGGRARAIEPDDAEGLDNGQHILIGAYTECLALLSQMGVAPADWLERRPLDLRDINGKGFAMPAFASTPSHIPLIAPLVNALKPLAGAVTAVLGTPWPLQAQYRLLIRMLRWQVSGFQCEASRSVADLCAGLDERAMRELIEPLCISALNLTASQASGQVFLRVIRDAILTAPGSSDTLIPKQDLSALFAAPATGYLQASGVQVHFGTPVLAITAEANAGGPAWHVHTKTHTAPLKDPSDTQHRFDRVILAVPAPSAARLVGAHNAQWTEIAGSLAHTAIATVYARVRGRSNAVGGYLPRTMLATPHPHPHAAQFVFDRSQLFNTATQTEGIIAAVVSQATGDRAVTTEVVMRQLAELFSELAKTQADEATPTLEWIQTVVEKRACFACTPGVVRPAMHIAPGLMACGDYVQGPYPSTLEGAVRNAIDAVAGLSTNTAHAAD